MSVQLTGLHLIGVHLTGLHFMGVHLIGVYLMGVYLIGVHLMGVYLTGGHLMDVYLHGACTSREIKYKTRDIVIPGLGSHMAARMLGKKMLGWPIQKKHCQDRTALPAHRTN